jgi:hypothetical protein
MAINTGIGVGEAQIFDTRGIMNNLYRQYEIKQKEDQAFANRLAEDLAKFDPSNLTGKDLQKVNDMYTQLKDYNHNISKMKKMDRALLEAKISQGMNDIKSFSTNAKQFYKDRLDFGIEIGKEQYAYTEDVIDRMDKIKNFSYTEALDNNMSDVNVLRTQRNPDNTLVDESIKEMKKIIDGAAVNNYPPLKVITKVSGDDVETIYHDAQKTDAEKAAYAIMTDNAKKFNWVDKFKRENPNMGKPADVDLNNFIVKTFEDKYGPNAYRVKTKEGYVSEGGAGGSIAGQDAKTWTRWLAGVYSKNLAEKQKYVNYINSFGGKKATLFINANGTIGAITYPLVTNRYGMTMPSIEPSKYDVVSSGDLNGILEAAGLSGKGTARSQSLYDMQGGGSGSASTSSNPELPKTPQTPPKNTNVYKPGFIRNGYKFKGGDPSVQSNWVKVK